MGSGYGFMVELLLISFPLKMVKHITLTTLATQRAVWMAAETHEAVFVGLAATDNSFYYLTLQT